jgi:hypothetical protein
MKKPLIAALCAFATFVSTATAQPLPEEAKGELKMTVTNVEEPPAILTPPFAAADGLIKIKLEKNPYLDLKTVLAYIKENVIKFPAMQANRGAASIYEDSYILMRYKIPAFANGAETVNQDVILDENNFFKSGSFQVSLARNKYTEITIGIQSAPKASVTGIITFTTNIDADVELIPKGDDYGISDVTRSRLLRMEADPGSYTLKVSKKGYKTIARPISVEKGKELNLGAIELEQEVGELTVTTEDLARVIVTGTKGELFERTAVNGIARFTLPPGIYEMAVTKEGFNPEKMSGITMEVGGRVDRKVNMKKAKGFAGDEIALKKFRRLKRNGVVLTLLTAGGMGGTGYFMLEKNAAKKEYDAALTPEDATKWRGTTEDNLLLMNASIGATAVFATFAMINYVRKNAAESRLERSTSFDLRLAPDGRTVMPTMTIRFGGDSRSKARP